MEWTVSMPPGQLLEASADGWRVRFPSGPQVLEPLLPKFFHVGEMPDVLGDRPPSVDLTMREIVIQSDDEHIQTRQDAAKPFDEVAEHPCGVTELELPLGPWRTVERDHDDAALRPATVPLDHAHWKLNPPSRPSTSRISPQRNTPRAFRDSSVPGLTSDSSTPPAVTSAFS